MAPILFAVVFIAALLVFAYATHSSETPTVVLIYLPFLLVIGYAYVALVHGVRLALSPSGLIERDQNAV